MNNSCTYKLQNQVIKLTKKEVYITAFHKIPENIAVKMANLFGKIQANFLWNGRED